MRISIGSVRRTCTARVYARMCVQVHERAGRPWKRRSLRYNGLFRSFSNYRVDNKRFDSREFARPLVFASAFGIRGNTGKNKTRKRGTSTKKGKNENEGHAFRSIKSNMKLES